MSKIEVKKKAAPQAAVTAWSFSRLTSYELCPSKFKFSVIEKLPEPGSPAMDRGQAIHKEGEEYLKGVRTEMPVSYELLHQEMEHAKQAGAESELEVTFTKDWGLTGWFEPDAWLRIKIDMLLREPGVIRLVDFKTGKNRGGYEDQLELYALAALLMHPAVEHVTGELWFVDSGEIISTAHGAYTQADVEELKAKWAKRVKPLFADTVFAPRPNNLCRWCHYRKENNGPCQY